MARRIRTVASDPLEAEIRWDVLAGWARRLPINFDPPLSESDPYYRRKLEIARLARSLRSTIVDPAERVSRFETAMAEIPWPLADPNVQTFLDSAPKALLGEVRP
jgi:hypothetical protein